MALAPNNLRYVGTRAQIYEKLGRRNDAITDYRAALSLDAGHQQAMDGLKRLSATP